MKTKYIPRMIIALLLWGGCSEYEMKTYELFDRINFIVENEYGESTNPEDMIWEKNFGVNPLGDRLKADTLFVMVKAQGNVSDHARKITFKIIPADCGIEIESLEEYVLPAEKYKSTYALLVKRPSMQDSVLEGKLTFDYEGSDFQAGVDEQQYFILKCSDIVNMDVLNTYEMGWTYGPGMDLGSWSNTKARFIINILGITDFGSWWWATPEQKTALVDALEAYKANPDNPPLYDETKFPEKEWISFN